MPAALLLALVCNAAGGADDIPPAELLPNLFGDDLSGVDDGFGLELCMDIEGPISDRLLEKDGCASPSGSGCQPELDEVQKLVILGSGPAGLSAAIYAARANLDPVVVSVDGGQLEGTSEVENYPGATPSPPDGCGEQDGGQPRPLHGVSGQAIVETFNQQAKAFGTRFIEGWVESISYPEPPFELKLTGGRTIRANSLIIASGASTKWLGIPSEMKYRGSGVSSCATCDGFFFKNQRVAVIGGGDTAMEEALFLARKYTKQSAVVGWADSEQIACGYRDLHVSQADPQAGYVLLSDAAAGRSGEREPEDRDYLGLGR